MRLATWNVNSVKARLPRLLDWLAATGPDVVCLQETKCGAQAFPADEVARLGYATAAHGDGRWNGVALLSRVGLDDVRRGFAGEPGFPDPETRAVSATCAGLRVWSVYVPNGRTPDDPHYAYKLRWLAALRDALAAEVAAGPVVVCGDFNVAPEDSDVWDPALFVASTHVTPAERDALAAIRALGFTDVVPRALKGPHPFTYWDYRAGMFHQNKGMRIDLVYASAGVATAVREAYVDREARKGRGPSDHAPVVVDLDVTDGPAGEWSGASAGAPGQPGRPARTGGAA
jgi:exodeoxyribonuclease-3